ncbi:MAG TPA: carboxypeptidase-like regulatory domain-containing protein [Terriglobia bacterium]|nr:carboxypeptidase-like regulatory domain-containing protein [Terriglobia bacterium]
MKEVLISKVFMRRFGTVVMALFVAAATNAWAQDDPAPPPLPGSQPGEIAGGIRTMNASMFRGATITLTNDATGETRTTTTTLGGDYEFKGLPEGTYTMRADSDGFAATGRAGIAPGSGPVDLQMRVLMMWEPLFPVFSWSFNTGIGNWVRESTWAFAYLEVFHLLGLTVLLGSVVALGLRISNVSMLSLSPAAVAREIRPFMLVGLALVLLSGLLMFAAEAEKLFLSGPFEWKIAFFVLANIFQFTAVSWVARAKDDSGLAFGKIAALLSIVFWYVVAWEGRAIAFF